MNLLVHKESVNIDEIQKTKMNSEALRIVREFQKQYRETIPHTDPTKYQWNIRQASTDEGVLKAQNYNQGSLSIL